MNYRSAPEPDRHTPHWRVTLEQVAASSLTSRLAAQVTQHPVLRHATATCSVDVLTVAFTSDAPVSAVEAVLPILEQAVAAVSASQEYPYELDVILRSDTPSTAQRCLSTPSRRIH